MPTIVDSPFGPIDVDEGSVQAMHPGVTLFEPAIRASGGEDGNPMILLGIRDGEPSLLTVDVNGTMAWTRLEKIKLDWRYDFKTESWKDLTGAVIEDIET